MAIDWSKESVLVTGSDGFIGSHLTQALQRAGAKVRAFVLYNATNSWGWIDTFSMGEKKNMQIHMGDIRNADNVRLAVRGCSYVFHLAALVGIPYSYINPESYVQTNVMGTLNLLSASRDYGVKRFIHTSTSEVYGTAQYVPMDEGHPLQAQSPYAASKIAADMLAISFYKSFKLPVSILRPFNTYGPRQSARAIIPSVISQIVSGFCVLRTGSLLPIRDMSYVIDVVDGFLKIAESDIFGEVMHIGSGCGISVGELINTIKHLMNVEVSCQVDEERLRPDASEVMKLICDYSFAKKVIQWEPRYSLEEGLKETIAFIKKNIERYKPWIYNM